MSCRTAKSLKGVITPHVGAVRDPARQIINACVSSSLDVCGAYEAFRHQRAIAETERVSRIDEI